MHSDQVAWHVEIAIPSGKTGMKLAHFIDVDDPTRFLTHLVHPAQTRLWDTFSLSHQS